MQPVNDKASRDAWIMLACAVDWEGASFAKHKTPGGGGTKGKETVLHKSSSGHGYLPEESASFTDAGKRRFTHHSACMGGTPRERQSYYYFHFRRNQ